jgi:tetratricopeptide (TPR) repeat protein
MVSNNRLMNGHKHHFIDGILKMNIIYCFNFFLQSIAICEPEPVYIFISKPLIHPTTYVEASRHLTTGLELLAALPDTPERSRQELDFLLALLPALTATKGETAPEVERLLTRAYALCQQLGASQLLFGVLSGLCGSHLLRDELQTAHKWSEECLHLAQDQLDAALLLSAHYQLGNTLYFLGDFTSALAHLEQGIALYDPDKHANPQITRGVRNRGEGCLSQASFCLVALGYPDQAYMRMQEALTLSRELTHP